MSGLTNEAQECTEYISFVDVLESSSRKRFEVG